jgi:penicillin-binding protein A
MSVNDAIGRLSRLFVVLFALLAVRQLWVQVVAGPRLSRDPHNPRAALLDRYRGAILARDGTVLAHSTPDGRVYPLGAALAQTIGYSSARFGTSGLEEIFDRELSAQPGANDPLTQLRAALGQKVGDVRPGATVITTLDPAIQQTLFSALSQHMRAAGVVLDPRTGEVLALASVPSFDPVLAAATFASVRDDPQSPLLNRALDGLYPPGSSFKIVTASNALEDGTVTLESTFDDPGYLRVGGFTLHDDEGEATGHQDLTGAFALSSNVDFGQIALDGGVDRWFDGAARWGLGGPLDFTLPAARDHLPDRAEVSPSILAQLGFGQADLLVTPLRMALVGATIAAGGTEPCPFLVREVRTAAGNARSLAPAAPLAKPISGAVADQVRTMMEAVVTRGTGTAAALPGVRVAGKTGTATLATGRAHAWFVAFAPADAPRVAVAIVVENGGYGGVAAAPIARRVLATALARGKS